MITRFRLTLFLALYSYLVLLTFYNIADYDLWMRLAQGAFIWQHHALMRHDLFAFTPVLPEYIDNEWGSGVLFFSLLKLFGPVSLMILKIFLAGGTIAACLLAGRLRGCRGPTLLLLAVPCAVTILPGYMNVIRCQGITFFLFSVTLLCLEMMTRGRRWSAFVIVLVMACWVNLHGGFPIGLVLIGIYTFSSWVTGRYRARMIVTLSAAVLATLLNPYGVKLWPLIYTVLVNPPLYNTDWITAPIFAWDLFTGFRILFLISLFLLIRVWNRLSWKESLPGLTTLGATSILSLHQYRHGPFFGIAALAVLGPYAEYLLSRSVDHLPLGLKKIKPAFAIFVFYALIAGYVSFHHLPYSSFQILAPVSQYPVREIDILAEAKAKGNLVVPKHWGGYAAWRLYPAIRVSSDGRDVTMYPDSTIDEEWEFFSKAGRDWDRLLKEYHVDSIILQTDNTNLRPEDLREKGFEMIWSSNISALFVRKELAPALLKIANNLPKETIEPLDSRIPDRWWSVKPDDKKNDCLKKRMLL